MKDLIKLLNETKHKMLDRYFQEWNDPKLTTEEAEKLRLKAEVLNDVIFSLEKLLRGDNEFKP